MKRILAVLIAGLALGLAACGGSNLKAASTNPQVQKDQAAAEKIVQGCLPKGNLLTHSGRQAIVHCIAPPGHAAAFQRCASTALAHSGILTKHQRSKFYAGLAQCVETNR